ncbi:AMP-binding protein [Bacillus pumilus]|nr:AMP-binding protein [Bacillus pumilus]
MFENRIRWLICILESLKAGVAFVPIDPSFPKERNKIYIEDSRTSLIITINSLVNLHLISKII